jgi:hypothetical protein
MNERDVAKGFASHWGEFFPMLSANFINAFNEAYPQPIFGTKGIVRSIPFRGDPHHADLVAEFSFALAAAAHTAGIPVKVLTSDDEAKERALVAAIENIRAHRGGGALPLLELNRSEQLESIKIARVYESFLALWPTSEVVEFSPQLAGFGVLGSCQADLSVGQTLYEVKTVSRNFHSRDLRQLIVYLALGAASGVERWKYGGLLNPREGVFCRFSVDWLIARLSGGQPPRLVLEDFLQALSRDVVLDRRF